MNARGSVMLLIALAAISLVGAGAKGAFGESTPADVARTMSGYIVNASPTSGPGWSTPYISAPNFYEVDFKPAFKEMPSVAVQGLFVVNMANGGPVNPALSRPITAKVIGLSKSMMLVETSETATGAVGLDAFTFIARGR